MSGPVRFVKSLTIERVLLDGVGGATGENDDRRPSSSRTRTGAGRDAAALFPRRRLIMTGPGRSRARPLRP